MTFCVCSGRRWKYEKQAHLHCMAFRKTQSTRQDYSEAELAHALLAIPQDRHQDRDEDRQQAMDQDRDQDRQQATDQDREHA